MSDKNENKREPSIDEIIRKCAEVISDDFSDCNVCPVSCYGATIRNCKDMITNYLREKVLE